MITEYLIVLGILFNIITSFLPRDKGLLYCGITGFSGVTPPNKDLLKLLMIYNSLERGKDSTGIYSPSKGIIKDNICTVDFLKKYNPFSKDTVFIAHARAMTIGAVTKKNAHPFKFNNTVLVHNGTLRSVYSITNKIDKRIADFEVDSEMLCYAVDKIKEPDFLQDVNGAIATIWTKTDVPDTIYVYRNYERPLYYGYIDKNMYISSIKESLEVIDCTKISDFETGELYTITNGKFTKRKLKATYKYNSTKYSNIAKHEVDIFHLLNRWVQACVNVKEFTNKTSIIQGNWYFVSDISRVNDSTIYVKDENQIEVPLSKYAINYWDFEICKNDYLMAMSDLTYAKDNKKFAKKGDILLCTEIYLQNKFDAVNVRTGIDASVPAKSVRKLTTDEIYDFLRKRRAKIDSKKEEQIMKEQINKVLDVMNEKVQLIKEKILNGENPSGEIIALEAIIDNTYFNTEIEKEEYAD